MKLLRSIFGFAVLALAIYGSWKVFPAMMTAYEFEDALKQEAKINAYNNRSEQEIRDTLLRKAKSLEIPLTADHLKVQRVNNELAISADYAIHVDFAPYPFDMNFHPQSKFTHYAGL